MTTFEIIVIILLVAIVGLFIINYFIFNTLKQMKRWQESIWNELRSIRVNVASTAEYTQNYIAPDVETLSNNFQYLLDGKKGVPALFDIVDKMHRNLCVEIADKMVDRVYPPTYVTPCYAPNGICTNPQMDCINCPKRGTGGTWTTSTNTNKKD
jgi:hypothetical protein